MVTKAFKIACLSYVGSNIVWEGKELSRETIIKLRRKLLDKISEQVGSNTVSNIIDVKFKINDFNIE